jgi:hypothetical protein
MFDCGRAYDSAELIHPALYGTMYLKHSSTPATTTASTAATAATATAASIGTGTAATSVHTVDAAYTTPVMAGYALVHTPQLVLQAAAATATASKAAATAVTAASNPLAVKLKPSDQCPTCLIRKPGCPLCWDMPDG